MTPRGGAFSIVGRLGWGAADQAVSSLSNFALGVGVAQTLGAEGFGAFSLIFLTYAFILSASRGLSTDSLRVRYSDVPRLVWTNGVSSPCGTAVMSGVLAGVGCIVAGLLLRGDLGAGFVALGLTSCGLLIQDNWRFAFLAAARPRAALLNDLVWAVLLGFALTLLHLLDRTTVANCVLALGLAATLAARFGYLQCRVRPRASTVAAWIVEHTTLGPRYLVENVAIGGARQVRFFLLGGLAGVAAVGETVVRRSSCARSRWS